MRATFVFLLVVHIAICLFLATRSGRARGDFNRFWQIASAEGRPYVDYPVEYPPLTLVVFKTLARVADNPSAFALGLLVLNLGADLILAGALLAGWGVEAAVFYAACVLPMLPVLYYRADLWSTAAATVAFALWQRHRRLASGVAFVVGVGLKLWPLPLSAWIAGDQDARKRPAVIAVILAGYFGISVAWIAAAGVTGIRQVVTFRNAHGWSIESIAGSILHIVGGMPVRLESGAWRIGSIPVWMSVLLFVIVSPLAGVAMYAGAILHRLGVAWIAAIGVLVLGSALVSPQFFVWMLPGAALAWFEGDRTPALAVAAAVGLSTAILATYAALVDGALLAELLVIARNLALVVAVVTAAHALLASSRFLASFSTSRDSAD